MTDGYTPSHRARNVALIAVIAAFVVVSAACSLPGKKTATGVTAVQAESFAPENARRDPTAWGAKALEIAAGDHVTFEYVSSRAGHVVVRARALCDDAAAEVDVSGSKSTTAALTERWTDIDAAVISAPGAVTVTVAAQGCNVLVDYLATRRDANPLAADIPWANPDGRLWDSAAALRAQGRADDAALVENLIEVPTALWVGDWVADPGRTVRDAVKAARDDGTVPVFVIYDIPGRDCGGFSAHDETTSGAADSSEYLAFVRDVAAELERGPSVVILEPDATAQDCPELVDRAARDGMLRDAIGVLADTDAYVYLDAGHAGWHSAAEQAHRLRAAGVEAARGFALNVANFRSTAETTAYAEELSGLLDGAPYIVDTSRAGGDSDPGTWCNPDTAALGPTPTFTPAAPNADGFLWVKRPAESDGDCDGAPPAGDVHVENLIRMARNAGW